MGEGPQTTDGINVHCKFTKTFGDLTVSKKLLFWEASLLTWEASFSIQPMQVTSWAIWHLCC